MRWRPRSGSGGSAWEISAVAVLAVSSATGEGLDELRRHVLAELPEIPAARIDGAGEPAAEFEAEHRVYRPAGEGGYRVEREEDGAFRIVGRGVELLFERHDLNNEEALGYLERRLNEIGVIAALDQGRLRAGRRRASRRARVRAAHRLLDLLRQ